MNLKRFKQLVARAALGLTLVAASLGNARAARAVCGTPGKDGPFTGGGVVNSYFASAQSASAGDRTVILSSSPRADGAQTGISVGDLLLLWQTQGATINSTNNESYGSGNAANNARGYTSLNGAGNYEFVRVTAVNGGTLTVAGDGAGGGLRFSYSYDPTAIPRQTFQVVRVPQYSSMTLTSALAPVKFDGTTGGGIFVDVAGTVTFSTTTGASVYQTGFRGGFAPINDAVNSNSNSVYPIPNKPRNGAGKGEGIAGRPRFVWNETTDTDNGVEGYPGGDGGRGAPGNAGGGGNAHNSGGGGGSNSGAGGRGGYPWEGQPSQAGTVFDTVANTNGTTRQVPRAWGQGAAALLNGGAAFTDHLFMGGGGGGGDANNATTGVKGGVGGGVIILRAGSFAGATTIDARGDAGDRGVFANAPDGAGGGGAGGTVILVSRNSSSASITVNAQGGAGGNTVNDPIDPGSGANNGTTSHGPGGGGGGGTVIYSGLSVTANLAGGTAGKTNDGGTGSISHGAAGGATGLTAPLTAGQGNGLTDNGDGCAATLTVTKSTTTPSVAAGTNATYQVTIANTGTGSAAGVVVDDALPVPFAYDPASPATIIYTVGASGPATLAGTNNTANGVTTTRFGTAGDSTKTFFVGAGASLTLTFAVKTTGALPAKYDNSATVRFAEPRRTDATILVSPGGKYANGTTVTGSNYNGTLAANTAEDVTIQGSVSGTVYLDANRNATLDSTESGANINNLFVKAVLSGQASAAQAVPVTAATGAFSFSGLAPGNYTLVLDDNATLTDITPALPAGYIGTESPGGTRQITVANQALQNQNFGLFNGAQISGSVFEDGGNGTGPGLGGVKVNLTKADGTIIDTTTTDASGNFAFKVPNSVGAGVLKVVEFNLSGYNSVSGNIGTTGGTYDQPTDIISFPYAAGSTYTGLKFGDSRGITFIGEDAKTGTAGSSVFYPHVFASQTAGNVTFTTAQLPTPANTGWSVVTFRDSNGNGVLDGGDAQITGPVAVAAGVPITIFLQNFIPTTAANGAQDKLTVTANFTPTTGAVQSIARSDLTTVAANQGLLLSKAVDKTTAKSGDVLVYTITYRNTGAEALTNLVVKDATPSYTTFQSATTGPLPTGLTAPTIAAPSANAKGAVTWTFGGILNPGQSGTVTFNVKVQ